MGLNGIDFDIEYVGIKKEPHRNEALFGVSYSPTYLVCFYT